MPTLTISKITKPADGSIRVQFGKRERVFNDLADLRTFVRTILTGPEELEAIALWLMLQRQPALANPAAFEGHSIVIDPSVNAWGTIT